ncbi:MAG: hypothetical protein QXD03_03150 [Candidatus Anstonellales archaeon]
MLLERIPLSSAVTSSIVIHNDNDKGVFLHIILDVNNKSISDYIYKLNINMANCKAVYIPVYKNMTFLGRTYNMREYYKKTKSELESNDDKSKHIRTVINIQKTGLKNKFVIVDREDLRLKIKAIFNRYGNKINSSIVNNTIDLISSDIEYYKSSEPDIVHIYVFVVDLEGQNDISIIDVIRRHTFSSENEKWLLNSDIYCCCIGFDNTMWYVISRFDSDDNKFLVSKNNIQRIYSLIHKDDKEDSHDKNDKIQIDKEKPSSTVINPFNFSVSKESLEKLANRINLNDPDILSNAKTYIENYVRSKKIDTSKIKDEDIYKLLIKSIKYSITGNDNVTVKDIERSDVLFNQLYDSHIFKKNVEDIVVIDNILCDPKHVNKINEVSSPAIKEFEFGENLISKIEYMFKSLEYMPKHRIKVEKIDKNYISDKYNSYIRFTVKLRNLDAGRKEPYTVSIKVPKLINGKYFRINGKDYICSNQLVFEPITKTDENSVRFLSNYSIVTVSINKMKFDIADINELLEYVKTKYPNIIKHEDDNKIVFNDGLDSYISKSEDDVIFHNKMYTLRLDSDGYVLHNNITNEDKHVSSKNEYILDYVLNLVAKINNKDKILSLRYSKSPSTVMIHIQGVKLPLIVFLTQQLGLLNAFEKLGVKYSIDDYKDDTSYFSLKLSKDKFLNIYAEELRHKLIINGIRDIHKYFNDENVNDKNVINKYIINRYGTRSIYNFDTIVKHHIDPITRDLLIYKNYPTNFIDVICGPVISKLINERPYHINDMRLYRVRTSELIASLLYKELLQAHRRYSSSIEMTGSEEERIYVNEDWIINSLLGGNENDGSSVLTFSRSFNPVNEIKDDTKLIKTGPGGIMSKIAFKSIHRDIHPTQIGIVGANSTTEYQDVGINIRHTINPDINTKYGFYRFKKISDETNPHEALTVDEMLTPFINQMDPTRAILSTTHAGQAVPIKGSELPIVSTPANFIIPKICSSKFTIVADDDGVVIDVKDDDYIEVKYKNGRVKAYDISTRLTATKRSTYIPQSMDHLEKGDKFKKGQLLAWSKGFFNGYSYNPGKNVVMALFNYMGFSHEDGYVITENIANKFSTNYTRTISAIIPSEAHIKKIVTEVGKEVDNGDILIEYSFKNPSEIVDMMLSSEEDEESDMTSNYNYEGDIVSVKAVKGKIIDIRIYSNIKSMPPEIKKLYDSISKRIKNKINKISSGAENEFEKASSSDNTDLYQLKIGGHKIRNTEFDGINIVYYITTEKTADVGDKIANRYGAKGIITKIISKDDIPKSEFTGNIDIFLSPCSMLGRKNIAILKEMYIGKIMYHLPNILVKKLNDGIQTSELRKLIIDVYNTLDHTSDKSIKNSVEKFLLSKSDRVLREEIRNREIKFNIVIPPFCNIDFESILSVSKMLDIPLEERVYIPEIGSWTKYKVPVGITYIMQLEQFGNDYRSIRSTAKYRYVTGQPTKGKKDIGGQTVAPLDVYALLNYDVPHVMKELMTAKSDDFQAKRKIISEITMTGKAPDDFEVSPELKSTHIKDIMLTGLGLSILK